MRSSGLFTLMNFTDIFVDDESLYRVMRTFLDISISTCLFCVASGLTIFQNLAEKWELLEPESTSARHLIVFVLIMIIGMFLFLTDLLQ